MVSRRRSSACPERRSARIGAALPLFGLLIAVASPAAQSDTGRVVAVGDIHGASSAVVALLEDAGILDGRGVWSGGRDTLVVTGDYTDRGAGVRDVLDLLIRLEEAAEDQVVVLLGNHEAMNLTANVRDVTPDIFARFATPETEARRERAFRDYTAHAGRRQTALGRPLPDLQSRERWMDAHPPGYVEYLEAMGPDGRYGRWLRRRDVAAIVGDTLFVHGGLAPDREWATLDDLNRRVRSELSRFDEMRRHLIEQDVILETFAFPEILTAVGLELAAWTQRLFPGPPDPGRSAPTLSEEERAHLEVLFEMQALGGWVLIDPTGPLWFRGFARWTDAEGEEAVPALLDHFGVTRIVVGHTVTASRRIEPRFGGRVVLIDTGMLASSYGGRPSALELADETMSAIYVGERVELERTAVTAR